MSRRKRKRRRLRTYAMTLDARRPAVVSDAELTMLRCIARSMQQFGGVLLAMCERRRKG